MQRRPVSALAIALATAIALPLGFAPPVQAAEPSVRPIALTKGHIDLFEVTYDASLGGLRMGIKDDTRQYDEGVVHRDPTTVTTYVDSELTATDVSGIDDNSPLSFLTVGGSVSTVYLLPQTQDQALPWPGWSTERLVGTLPAGVELPASGSPVRLGIEVDGPGEVFAWQTGTFGGVGATYIDTVDPAADEIPIARNAHVHTNWAFTALGDYTLTVTPTATTTSGDTLSGAGVVYRLHVGPAADAAPQATTVPSIAGTGVVAEALTLALGEWLPNPHTSTVAWLLDGEPIDGATGTSYTPVADEIGKTITARITATVGAASTEVTTAGVQITTGEPPVELLPTSFQSFTVTPASPRIGGTLTLTAVVNPRGGTAAAPLGVGGIVEFYRGSGTDAVKLGESAITSLTLSRATFSVPATVLGANTFSARYLPPSTHEGSTSAPATVTVSPAVTSVATAASLSEAAIGQPVVVAAAVTPAAASGEVRILNGDAVIAEGPVVQGRFQATVDDLPAGSYALHASFTSAVPEYADSVSLATLDVPLTIVEGAPRGTWSRTVVDHEHVDVFSVSLDDSTLKLGTRIDLDGSSKTSLPKYGSNRERLEPADTVFLLPDKVSTGLGQPGGRKTVPNNPNYAFLGDPGETVWIAPASNDLTPFLYAGFESESIANGQLKDNRIDLHLVGVDAPAGGRFEVYTGALTASASPWRMLSSTDPEYSSTPFGVGTHDHFSWAFTKLGTYVLHVKATATLADGTPVETETKSFTWVIGDLASAPDVAVAEDAGAEDAAALTATVSPASAGYVEFWDGDGLLLGFAPVADGVATLPMQFAAGSHQVSARYLPSALDERLPADSGVVSVQVAPAVVPEPTPSVTPTPTPSASPTPTPSLSPTPSTSPTPSVSPAPTASPTPSASPTTPAPAPTKKLTATPVPKITGTAKVGKVLTAKPGTWKPAGVKLTYQWYRGAAAISGATKASYRVQPADSGTKLTVKVTGSKAGYISVAKKSKATKKVAAGTLTTAKPKISGTTKVGAKLTAKPGTWKPAGVRFTYQWYRSGKKIGGATRANYVLTAKDKRKKITVKVTGKAAGYATKTTTSKATGKIR